MTYHLSIHALLLGMAVMFSACTDRSQSTPAATETPTTTQDGNSQDSQPISSAQNDENSHADAMQALLEALAANDDEQSHANIDAKPIISADGKVQIDWAQVDTQVARVDKAHFAYPFAIDSNAVKNYAQSYDISPAAAQHSMTVIMAAPEALGKIADQLTGKYLGHEFSDGEYASLIIHTTSDVVGERHEYVFADKFAEGLVLPIEIRPKSE